MARLHTYYISNGKSLLNYPVDDVDDDKFNEEVNRSIIEFDLEENENENEKENENDLELTEEVDNIEEYEEEEEVIQPGENDIAGEGETFDKYFNINNHELRELLKIQVSVVIDKEK
jgi:hypothetical protein